MRVATEEFFSVMNSCCCLTGLGLGLNILVLFPSLAVVKAIAIIKSCHVILWLTVYNILWYVTYTVSQKNVPTLKRYRSKL